MSRDLRSALRVHRVAELWNAARAFRRPWRVAAAYVHPSAGAFPLTVHTRRGSRFAVEDAHDAATAWVVWARREYPVPPDARSILDLGAHFGAFTLHASEAAPGARIAAVEPHPDSFARLRRNLSLNGLDGRVTCWREAVAGAAGERWMSADPRDPAPSRGIHPPGRPPDRRHVLVEGRPLRELLEEVLATLRVPCIDLVKVDVEGAEHELLPGLTREVLAPVRRWVMEYHPNGPREPLFAALEAAGLRCLRDRRDHPGSGVAWFSR
jgi:FkbM family methyltransferase